MPVLDVGGPRAAVYTVTVDGKDVSSNFHPVLISLAVTLYDGGQADTVEIELDDAGGQIALPRVGASIAVSLGWADSGAAPMFDGFTDEPKSHRGRHRLMHRDGAASEQGEVGQLVSAGGRSRGRVLTLTGKSANMGGKLKTRQEGHIDGGTFGDAAKKWGQAAGLSDVAVSGDLAAIRRPYWAIGNESFMAWGQRVAGEIGATFKILGTRAVFLPRAGGQSASGTSLGGVAATWGDNLIDWSITPLQSRPVFSSFAVRHYDVQAAKWKAEKVDGPQAAADAVSTPHVAQLKRASADIARNAAAAAAAESAREKGAADSVVIDGEPLAQPEAPCTVSGVRPGADGSYLISRVRHELRRSSGFVTTLGLKQPSGGAGTDSRTSVAPATAAPGSAADPNSTRVTTPANSGGIGSA